MDDSKRVTSTQASMPSARPVRDRNATLQAAVVASLNYHLLHYALPYTVASFSTLRAEVGLAAFYVIEIMSSFCIQRQIPISTKNGSKEKLQHYIEFIQRVSEADLAYLDSDKIIQGDERQIIMMIQIVRYRSLLPYIVSYHISADHPPPHQLEAHEN